MKKGRALEQLILILEKVLAGSPSVTVESPKKLRDITTGKLREHDVLLTVSEGHHSFLIAIECRDRSRPITVNQVEGFWAKCQHTGIGQGIIVSTKGFYKTARTKADHLGIRCLEIEKAESFNWLFATELNFINTRIHSINWIFFPATDGVIKKSEFDVVDKEGNIATMDALTAKAQKHLNKIIFKNPDLVDEKEIKLKFTGTDLVLRSQTTGEMVPVNFAVVKIQYSVTEELVPFRLVQYKDKEEVLSDAAYADLKVGDYSARVLFQYKENEGGMIVVMPKKDK